VAGAAFLQEFTRVEQDQRTGIAATISLIAAIASFIITCAGHAIWGLVLAIIAVSAGITGLVIAASPRISAARCL
jgi:hypothetical protein